MITINKSDKSNNESVILLLINLILISVVFFVGYENFIQNEWIFLIVIAITAITTTILFFNIRYHNNMKRILNKINTKILDISENKQLDFSAVGTDDDLLPFYNNLKKLNTWANTKQSSYQDILKIVNSVALNVNLDKLLDSILPKLIDTTDSNCGAVYLVNNANGKLSLRTSVGFSKNIYSEFDLSSEEGFFGFSFQDKEIKIMKDVPDDTVYIMRTFLGKIKPHNIMFIPIIDDNEFMGIIILASIYSYTKTHLQLFEIVRSYIGVSVSNALTFERTTRLSNELKFQNRLVQDLNDDLEKKVSQRTYFLKNIIDNMDDLAIYAIDKDFRITAWNKGAEKLFGIISSESIGKPIEQVFSSGVLNLNDVRQKFEIVKSENKITESSWRKKKDGDLYYAEFTYFKIMDDDGSLLGYASITKDLTETRKADDALWLQRGLTQKILDSSSRALVVTDSKGQIELFNNNACRLLKTSTVFGKKISDFFDDENELLNIIKYISQGNHIADTKFSLKDKDGELVVRINSLYDRSEITIKLLIHLYVQK